MRVFAVYIGWVVTALALGFVLAQYTSTALVMSFVHKLPGCF